MSYSLFQDPETARMVRELRELGLSDRQVADRIGCSPTTVRRIRKEIRVDANRDRVNDPLGG